MKFKIGDKVKLTKERINEGGGFVDNHINLVGVILENYGEAGVEVKWDDISKGTCYASSLELAESKPETPEQIQLKKQVESFNF